jgi:hypothetical protein
MLVKQVSIEFYRAKKDAVQPVISIDGEEIEQLVQIDKL